MSLIMGGFVFDKGEWVGQMDSVARNAVIWYRPY
jgi:hypothetical protein